MQVFGGKARKNGPARKTKHTWVDNIEIDLGNT
jgi:hypothetical protein